MNKIYKVIWSKTRNCYVAVAEFVKRNGKGGTSLNRRHIAAALAAVGMFAAPAGAMANSGGSVDGAGNYIGNAPYNVTINEQVNGIAYGHYETGNVGASGATLSIVTGGKAKAAFGGRAADGPVTENNVFMSGGEIVGGNSIVIEGLNVSGMLFGGFANAGNVEKNTVEISGGTVNSWLIGGYSTMGAAKENSVTVSGGEVKGSVYGGRSLSGNAANNTVTVSGGTVSGVVNGGLSYSGDATENTVTISGGTVKGGVYGGHSANGNAANNTVIISGGTVNNDVYGGRSNNSDATNNTVTISGGKVGSEVYGGWSLSSDATNNTVILSRQGSEAPPDINGTLFGGFSYNGGAVSNNTLQVEAVGLSASQIQNFENYRFVLPSDVKKGDTMLTLKGQGADLTIDGSKVDMAVAKGSGLNIDFDDDSVTLLHKTGGGGAFSVTNLTGEVQTSKLDGVSTGFDVMKYTLDKPDHEDKLNVTVSELHLYGDGGTNTPGRRQTGNTLEIKGGKANVAFGGRASSGAVTENHVIMNDGEIVDRGAIWAGDRDVSGMLIGGFAEDGNVEKNTVELSGGTVGSWVMGGYSVDGDITNNTVTVSGGTVRGFVYGGHSSSVGAATDNTVTIRGGTVSDKVYGGYSEDGDAKDNTVILSKVAGKAVPVIKETLFGGFSLTGAVSGNTLQVESVGLSAPEIQNFDNYRFMLPSDIKASDTMLQLTNQNDADVTIDPNRVSFTTDSGFGLNLGESITLLHKTGGSKTLNLTGSGSSYERLDGEADGLPVKEFKLNVSQEKDKVDAEYAARYLYGDGGTNTPGQRQTGNTLEIKGGKATAAFGGRATTGDVTGNKVEMSGGELVYDTLYADIQGSLYGGLTDKGNANHNTVTVSGGKLKERVYGGASYDGNTENNTVTIKGGTVGTQVHGGRTYGGGNAVNNTVTIEGGTVGKRVYGGRSDGGNAVNNTVTIQGGTAGERVYGGRSDGGNAVNNTVTIQGGTVGERVYGGYASAAATGNAVNLTGTTHGLDGAKLYGYNDSSASHSGNELHIGGAKTYDENGTATITKGSWQGMDANGKHTNRVDTVANFDSIALHNVVWGDVPAISANEITNIGGLDVTGLEFFTHPDNSTVHEHAYKDYMVLVHADTNDLTGLKISYLDEGNVKTETLTNQGIHYHTAPHSSTENGVTVDGKEVKRIFLADHNKSVDFFYHITGDKLTVGEVEFVKGGTARILDGRFDVRNAAIDTEGLTFSEASWNKMHTGDTMTIVDAEDAVANKNGATLQLFTTRKITKTFAESDAAKSITIEGLRTGTLAQDAAQTKLTYTVGTVDIDTVRLGTVSWNPNVTMLNASGDVFRYGTVQGVDAAGFTVDYKNPQTVEANKTMTLLQANNTLQANALLQKMAADEKTKTYSYQFAPADGVTVAARITGSLGTTAKGDGFTYTVNSNQADKLTFGSVDWKDSGALFKRPAAVTFAGADVDTSEIHFRNVQEMQANKQMTLVSDFGGSPGRITGTTYKIGTTLEGEGAASLANGDLIFTTKAGTKNHAQDQTHNTVMGMMAGLAALAGGTEQLSQGMDSFGGTTGSGSSDSGQGSGGQEEAESGGMIIASIGGDKMRQETGSHVTSNTWNGVLGIGGKRAVKSGTWQYAAFAEHGRANFTLHSDAGRGDGTSKYTGGGLLAKWQSRHDVYVEGSIRAGRMHDTASDLLYDAATGQSYGYDVHANYIGGHVGLGKVFRYNNGRSLDVYGKYFHMKRDGVSFEAEGHYDLDSVTSSVLRVGARYGATDKKWNWYGGLAYEYEFDGKATGRADGAEIRAASIKGGSVRGELGLRMEATKTSPWKADIRLTGYAGKRRGIGGNVSVAYTF